jgi:hypothetical protein
VNDLAIEGERGTIPNSTHPVLVAALHPERDETMFTERNYAVFNISNEMSRYTKFAIRSISKLKKCTRSKSTSPKKR